MSSQRLPLNPAGERLEALLRQRIVYLDGAMGTMIQQLKLQEEDYRGDRFKDHPGQLKGNNDLLYRVENYPIDLLRVRDDDIPTFVADGVCDLGIVGENVLEEVRNGGPVAEVLMPLGFGLIGAAWGAAPLFWLMSVAVGAGSGAARRLVAPADSSPS